MANLNAGLVLAVVVLATLMINANTSDPNILTDFIVPEGVAINGDFFAFQGLRSILAGTPPSTPFKVTKVSEVEHPALNGQSVSLAALQFLPGGINPPHIHPRSSELLVVVQGYLEVGLVTADNKLFTQILRAGDMFVFPKGLVHFQVSRDYKNPTLAISAFGSANAGTVALPGALFRSGIETDVLAKSFRTDTATIEKLVSAATMG